MSTPSTAESIEAALTVGGSFPVCRNQERTFHSTPPVPSVSAYLEVRAQYYCLQGLLLKALHLYRPSIIPSCFLDVRKWEMFVGFLRLATSVSQSRPVGLSRHHSWKSLVELKLTLLREKTFERSDRTGL